VTVVVSALTNVEKKSSENWEGTADARSKGRIKILLSGSEKNVEAISHDKDGRSGGGGGIGKDLADGKATRVKSGFTRERGGRPLGGKVVWIGVTGKPLGVVGVLSRLENRRRGVRSCPYEAKILKNRVEWRNDRGKNACQVNSVESLKV